ncbi:uncharacterized protein LOC114543654 [Dendronephthya gigantea]|uniref:uncharacterized protein LOC114543654 n=1 Tax=Dendronephthya gigantea TaxID=151771 RepID=UPI00106B2010|nr:uncharacterized protein LOC114543654 [Dendronephthya gigantea]
MVNYTCLNDLIRMYVKGWTQYRNRGRLVCAVSRYGLVGLLKKFRINYSDLNTQVVNPTEEVAWSLLRRSYNEMISDPANEPKIREFLEYVGFVPRLVESLIQECRVQKRKGEDIEAIIARVTRSTIKNLHYVLNEDVQSLSPGSRYAHICALALCVSRGLHPAELPTLVDKMNVSWTCLKETSDEVLTSVSPLATHVVNQHLSTDVSLRDETVELLKQVNLKGESNVRGYIFETLIFSNFTSASARLTLLGMTKDRKEVNLTTLSQAGVVLNQKQFTSTFEPEKNICYATPNMKGVDFILSLEREVYLSNVQSIKPS